LLHVLLGRDIRGTSEDSIRTGGGCTVLSAAAYREILWWG